ncbi:MULTISPECIES: hypothetical protein [unclassified Sphingomonas]|jgi:hypothetical protein|uniref:hypothetical protein n=1 Tax=unclassified Sphingomonas TaxID=196159 RepID=UPI001300548E|nr:MULTISPECIES: hypothetical protein [unclassified Sphingomonas]
MSPAVRLLTAVQAASLLGLVAALLRPAARWSLRARLPVALLALFSSAALLVLHLV